ncbi:hypothetical protein DXG01_001763 [Tephrocybe rancida]|nr:hypothetical protein DXG01_001763 [Tephrocybe rancida]
MAACALLRSGPHVQGVLSVPESDEPVIKALCQELKFINLQRRYQRLFEKSQEQREVIFKEAVRKRRHVFDDNEARRVVKFERLQRQWKNRFGEREERRESDFLQPHRHRETVFQNAEQRRQAVFHQKEISKDKAFRQAQNDQVDCFHKKKLPLQEKCIDAGKKPIADSVAWGKRLCKPENSSRGGWVKRQSASARPLYPETDSESKI